ncbi:hypothetical protein Avbf_00469 [Armadillidium vulgare]|nr:hypothetical protein Avbf_00469 [Armadillidium vulgare]
MNSLIDAAEGGSDEDLTTSEAFTNTLSEDFSLPLALQRHLEELKKDDLPFQSSENKELSDDDLVHVENDSNPVHVGDSSSDNIQQQLLDLPKDPSNVKKDDVPFQSTENKELTHGDAVHVEDDSSEKADQQLQDLPKDPPNFENDDELFHKASVRELASTLVEETTKNALQHISSLTPEEISKRKNEALNLLESSIGTTHEIISAVGENTGKNNFSLESNLNFQSKTNLQEQPGEVIPLQDPLLQSDINTSFSLENVNLTDHCTQSVTPTPLFEDPALKSEDGCSKELRSPSPDSSILIAETIREQESAFKQSSLDSHETDMNHKEEDDSSEFEEASDKELIKQMKRFQRKM